MFTIAKDYLRKPKRRPSIVTDYKGNTLPLVPFKPSYINLNHFAQHRDCAKIMAEHPWLANIKMYENPALTDQLVKADFKRLMVELSTDVLQEDLTLQRDIFIRVLCQFLAQKLFNDLDQDEPYQLLVKRYSAKTMQINTSRNHKLK